MKAHSRSTRSALASSARSSADSDGSSRELVSSAACESGVTGRETVRRPGASCRVSATRCSTAPGSCSSGTASIASRSLVSSTLRSISVSLAIARRTAPATCVATTSGASAGSTARKSGWYPGGRPASALSKPIVRTFSYTPSLNSATAGKHATNPDATASRKWARSESSAIGPEVEAPPAAPVIRTSPADRAGPRQRRQSCLRSRRPRSLPRRWRCHRAALGTPISLRLRRSAPNWRKPGPNCARTARSTA
jgi:hypothetical protein